MLRVFPRKDDRVESEMRLPLLIVYFILYFLEYTANSRYAITQNAYFYATFVLSLALNILLTVAIVHCHLFTLRYRIAFLRLDRDRRSLKHGSSTHPAPGAV